MGPDFHDIDIPPRMTEYALPLDTAIKFVFVEEPGRVAAVDFFGRTRAKVCGRGRILLADGFFRIQELSVLGPVFGWINDSFPPAILKFSFGRSFPSCSRAASRSTVIYNWRILLPCFLSYAPAEKIMLSMICDGMLRETVCVRSVDLTDM